MGLRPSAPFGRLPAEDSAGLDVKSGSSASTVPIPTATASDSPRHRCTSARLDSPEIHFDSPPLVATRPSRVTADFIVTSGLPVRACFRNAWLSSRAAAASAPSANVTSIPSSRSTPGPRPLAFSDGSSAPITTRSTPAAMIASVHGGCLPWCAHGSSVTYIVAPRGSSPRSRESVSAATSACTPPSAA